MTGKTHIAAGIAAALALAGPLAQTVATGGMLFSAASNSSEFMSLAAGFSSAMSAVASAASAIFAGPGSSATSVAAAMSVATGAAQPTARITCCLVAILGGAIGGLFPDADVSTSQASQGIRRGWAMLAVMVAAVLVLDHFAATSIALWLWSFVVSFGMNQLAGLAILVAICACGRVSGHRGFSHSIVALCLATFAIHLALAPIAPFFAAGYASHLLLDVFNRQPERLLWPFRAEVSVGLCKSGGIFDTILCVAFIAADALLVRGIIT